MSSFRRSRVVEKNPVRVVDPGRLVAVRYHSHQSGGEDED